MRSRCLSVLIQVLFLPGLTALPADRSASAEDPPPSKKAKAGEKASPRDLAGQWADLIARREKMQATLDELNKQSETADFQARRKIEANLMHVKAEFENELRPAMEKIAPAILETS